MLSLEKNLSIEGINQPTILSYFENLNQGNFKEVSQLFEPDNGQLYPPFEDPIIGAKAIAIYLLKEAKGLKAYPQVGKLSKQENNHLEIEITGRVKTLIFSVNVAWIFVLNHQNKIQSVTVKLLASPQELLGLKKGIGNSLEH